MQLHEVVLLISVHQKWNHRIQTWTGPLLRQGAELKPLNVRSVSEGHTTDYTSKPNLKRSLPAPDPLVHGNPSIYLVSFHLILFSAFKMIPQCVSYSLLRPCYLVIYSKSLYSHRLVCMQSIPYFQSREDLKCLPLQSLAQHVNPNIRPSNAETQ